MDVESAICGGHQPLGMSWERDEGGELKKLAYRSL